jgi:hypothetical protein
MTLQYSLVTYANLQQGLEFTIEHVSDGSTILLLNGDNILPLDAKPPSINAPQLPTNITANNLKSNGYDILPWVMMLPLQYEHTVLRTQEQDQLWVQFDVTGLPLDQIQDPRYPSLVGEPVALDKKEQKLVQLLLQQQSQTDELFIKDVQVVTRADRVQPYRMKCGRLAMVQTTYDPREWDKYGKYGTWIRMYNFVLGEIGMWPLALSFAGLFVLLSRRLRQQGRHQVTALEDDTEIALLAAEHEDAPPAYADIPVIKVEEYD